MPYIFEDSCTKSELLQAVSMLEARVDGQADAKIARVQGVTTSAVKTRIKVICHLVASRMAPQTTPVELRKAKWRVTPTTAFNDAELAARRASCLAAIEVLRADLSTLDEEHPIEQLSERAKGDLRGLSWRVRHCLRGYLNVSSKAELIQAVKDGKVNEGVPNLGRRSILEIDAFLAMKNQ